MKKYADIKIVFRRPPFWRVLKLFFPAYDPDGTVAVAFGRVVFANQNFSEDFKIHEETHLIQQRRSYVFATLWWVRYLFSKKFRFSQELEAFRRQYRHIKEFGGKDRFNAKVGLAHALSSPLYGNIVSASEAMKLLEQ